MEDNPEKMSLRQRKIRRNPNFDYDFDKLTTSKRREMNRKNPPYNVANETCTSAMTPDESCDYEKPKSRKRILKEKTNIMKATKAKLPSKKRSLVVVGGNRDRRTSRWRTGPSTAQANIVNMEMEKQINDLNNDLQEAEDFSLLIEQVEEDDYVMKGQSTSFLADNNETKDKSCWVVDTPGKKIPSNTPKNKEQSSLNASFRLSDRPSLAPFVTSTPLITGKLVARPSEYFSRVEKNKFYYLRGFMGEPSDFNHLLYVCEQNVVFLWDELLTPKTIEDSKKLGEGVYGEVFKANLCDADVALKILPFLDKEVFYEGLVNGEHMKKAGEILPEILITKSLSELEDQKENGQNSTSNFVRLIKAAVVKGEYPITLLHEWDKFDKLKGSENDRPSTYASPNQLFIVLALGLGGKDLENYTIRSEEESISIFLQIALSLAVSEEKYEFEHRDLHVGNVLIKQCPKANQLNYILNGQNFTLKSFGVVATIIDFTNSRMSREGTTIFLDLSTDEELFNGKGDYQFDIYRMMRDKNGDDWKSFTPKTNIFWMHYLSTKLFQAKKISARRRKIIQELADKILGYERIKEFIKDESIVELINKYLVNV